MIQIQNLQFGYTKNKTLFADLNLELKPGKIYGLLGKNGTGKSTLLKLMMGGLYPHEGSVMIEDHAADDRKPAMLQDIYYLSEDFDHAAISIAAFQSAYGPFYPKFDSKKFDELLSLFEIEKGSSLADLSYGQRKKVYISFGIATQTTYLLMDEPTNGLDIPSKSQFRKALLRGFKEDQIIIISTHQVRDLNQLIESVIILEEGQIVFSKDVFDLEEKLDFNREISEENLSNLIFRQAVPGGYINIQPNTTGKASEVELEVLFNAVMQDAKNLNQYLN